MKVLVELNESNLYNSSVNSTKLVRIFVEYLYRVK